MRRYTSTLLWLPLLLLSLSFLLINPRSVHTQPVQPHKFIALTFDDGPSPLATPQILSSLSRYRAHATFFVLGSQMTKYPQLVRKIINQGSMVANHGWQHLNLQKTSPSTLWKDAHRTFAEASRLHVPMARLYRPPYGYTSPALLHAFAQQHVRVVLWSIDTRDWSGPGTNAIVNKVLQHVKNGSIVLLHDGGGRRTQTIEALDIILNVLTEKGYHLVTLSRLLKNLPNSNTGPIVRLPNS